MPDFIDMILGVGAGKPGAPQSRLDKFISNPFLLNLLAQQGSSLTPGPSPIGVIGRAGLATAQQKREDEKAALNKQLIESQIGRNEALSAKGSNPTAGNIQSVQKGENGNFWIATRGGEFKDTGVPFNQNVEFLKQADDSVIAVDRTTAQPLGTVISPEDAKQATVRAAQTDAEIALPEELARLDATIRKTDETVQKIDDVLPLVKPSNVGVEVFRKDLPGFLGGEVRTLNRAIKSLQANFGFDTLNEMRQASKTGGALGQVSERELELLINALQALDQGGDVDVLRENLVKVQTHYNNYKREIEKMKRIMRRQAGEDVEEPTKPIEEMTDSELQAIIDGG